MIHFLCRNRAIYLIGMELKRQGIHRPEQTNRLRTMLNIVLSMSTVVSVSHKRIVNGTNDLAFDDVEDSYMINTRTTFCPFLSRHVLMLF